MIKPNWKNSKKFEIYPAGLSIVKYRQIYASTVKYDGVKLNRLE